MRGKHQRARRRREAHATTEAVRRLHADIDTETQRATTARQRAGQTAAARARLTREQARNDTLLGAHVAHAAHWSIGPVLARLRAFLLRDFVRKTMQYPRSSFDMGRILDGGVLLCRLPKGMLGEETARLLGSMILARVWQAATARARMAADARRDCLVVLDECQNFLNLASSLDTMLAEARKYRLSLVLAHQNLAQFPRDLLEAASANARNKVYFTCSPRDARELSQHTMPELDEHDLAHLDAYTAATRLLVGGRQLPAFTMRTRPARPLVGEATAIRQIAAAAVPAQDTSPVNEVVRRATQREKDRQRRRRPPAGSDRTGNTSGAR